MEFEVIKTQEELDKVIGDRISRAKEKANKEAEEKYKGYLSPDDVEIKTKELNEKITKLTNDLSESKSLVGERDKSIVKLNDKIKTYETDSVKIRIAHEYGLNYELAARLRGENEDEIKKDAESLRKIIGFKTPPDHKNEEGGADDKNEQFKGMLNDLKLGGN